VTNFVKCSGYIINTGYGYMANILITLHKIFFIKCEVLAQ